MEYILQNAYTGDFYPRPPRGGRLVYRSAMVVDSIISIHALREEGDLPTCQTGKVRRISIHALREEGDKCHRRCSPLFLHFYPRPPRGGRQRKTHISLGAQRISIHALREEGDANDIEMEQIRRNFYPRPPRGGRLGHLLVDHHQIAISIHALREEGDSYNLELMKKEQTFLSTPSARRATSGSRRPSLKKGDFYPRPPRGGRRPR